MYRPAVGGWYVSGKATQFLGLSSDIPVPADYLGSNVAQIGVFRPTSGAWYLSGQATQFLGVPGDVPLDIPYAIRTRHCSLNAC